MKGTQLLLLLVGASLAHATFKSGSNFCDDDKERFEGCKPLVNRDGCDCSSSSSSESGGDNTKESSGDNTKESSGDLSSGSWEASGNCSGSGSGDGDISWECSGSASGSWEHSGSGSWEHSGSGSGSWEHSGSGDSGEWHDGDYCFILQFFLNISISWEVEIREIFLIWINETQVEIVQNKNLTEYEILVKLYYSLQILFEKHVEIRVLLEYEYIVGWGYVFELEGLCNGIQGGYTSVTVEEVITIVGGSCPLFDAIDKCSQNATADEQDAIQVLIGELTVIIEGSYSFSYKLVLIFQKFQAFFAKYPGLKSLFFSLDFEIEGYGVIGSFIDLCNVYWRIENFEVAIGGEASSECDLIQVLTGVWQNTSLNTTTRSNVKELTEKLTTYFEAEISVEIRIQYFAEQLYQFFILYEWEVSTIYECEIEGYGSIYQLIYAYIYCTNNNVTIEHPTTTSTTTTSTSTTTTTTPSTTTTTTTTTTKPTTTTTKPNGNCGTVTTVNVVSANITLLLSSIDESQSTQTASTEWTTSRKSSFLGYKKRIYNLSIDSTTTAVQKFNSIKTVLTGFTTDASFKAFVHAIFIQQWGTIGQYCGCSL